MRFSERLFSVRRTPYKTVVRVLFLKFFWRPKMFSPDVLRNIPEERYPELLRKWYSLTLNGEELDLHAPLTFNHKLQWLKFYGDRVKMTELADKVRVRKYVRNTIGERYLVPIIGVYDKAEDIPWSELPERFVLKPNHGSHWVRMVEDKKKLDIAEVTREANGWLKEDYSIYGGFEMQYRGIAPKLVIERHLGELTHDLNDYKVWCFNGKPHYIQVFLDRYAPTGCKTCFYSLDWNKQRFYQNYPLYPGSVPRPKALPEMLACAEKLAAGIPFVRVDFYSLDDGSLRFGELTFTPSSGACPWHGEEGVDRMLGDKLELPTACGPLILSPSDYVQSWIQKNAPSVLHVLPDEKFTEEVIDFVEKYFTPSKHVFIISGGSVWPIKFRQNVLRANIEDFVVPNCIHRVIWHSLFSRKCVSYLYKHRKVLKKSIWVTWGADLYRAARTKKDDYVRRNFLAVAGLDGAFYQSHYGRNVLIECLPVVDPNQRVLLAPHRRTDSEKLKILANHACHPETIELLNTLAEYKDYPVEIYTVLSYGRMEFKDDILRLGQKLFGDAFKPVCSFMSIEDYSAFVSSMDIVVLNFKRQAGMGLCNLAVLSKVKVFVDDEASHFDYYRRNGVRFIPTSKIRDMCWDEFISVDKKVSEENLVALSKMLNPYNAAKKWDFLFEPYDRSVVLK